MRIFKKIRKWFNQKILSEYLITYHPEFLNLVQVMEIKLHDDKREKKAREIMKTINNSQYRRFFYRAVSYNPVIPELPETPSSFSDKLKFAISKIYIILFRRDIYKKIQFFKRIAKGVIERDKKIDDYMKNTTVAERMKRAQELNIIDAEYHEKLLERVT